MQSNLVVTDAVKSVVREAIPLIGDWFDGPPKVSLIQGDFVANDPLTWPAVAATVPAINGTAITPWEIMWDAVELNYKLVAPEPVGGWDFVSSGAGESITGFKVELAADVDNKIGAIRFTNPIPLTGAGQHIMLPYVTLPLDDIFSSVVQPYSMP